MWQLQSQKDLCAHSTQKELIMLLTYDIDKGLILIYASSNHHIRVNYGIACKRMNDFTKNPKNKEELITTLHNLANHIEKSYPGFPIISF